MKQTLYAYFIIGIRVYDNKLVIFLNLFVH